MKVKLERHRSYRKEFKQNAVEMLIYGKKTTKEVAQELGVPVPNLLRWRRQFLERTETEQNGPGENLSPAAMEQQIRALKGELERTSIERDILKKAVSIFSRANDSV